MVCISFFNVISKQQLKSSLGTNAMKHSTGENWVLKGLSRYFIYKKKVWLMDSPSTDQLSYLGVFVVLIRKP